MQIHKLYREQDLQEQNFQQKIFLPNNPFQLSSTFLIPTQTALSVNAANSDLVNGDHVRFRNVKTPLLTDDGAVYYKAIELELATTLTNANKCN